MVRTVALFRDVKTSDALRGASPKIRKIFQDAGFELAAHDSGIAPDVYPPADQVDRDQILQVLFANIKSQGVQGEYSGEFDLLQFMAHVKRARPVQGVVQPTLTALTPEPMPVGRTKRRALPGRIGFALGLAVILFVLFKFLEATGAATP
ncbi:hypothetical protein ABLN87_07585 [Ruegeria sp. SCPT10]|uniref:hypothetical protein n=1 Tax=Ruegeria sp. SCP10 TaxID=3141377 RepID=UPI0033367176